MRLWILLTLILISFTAHAEVSQDIGVLGFQAWKASRIDEAKKGIEKAQTDISAQGAKSPEAKVTKAQEGARLQKGVRADQRLQQAQLNLETAQDLSVNDYFVLYLNQFKDRSAFVEAAQKLNAVEAADLMMAYQKHLASASATEAALPTLPGENAQIDGKTIKR
jgi:hypothetical protein